MTLINTNEYKTMAELIYKEETFKIIGVCMNVHNILGGGFLEIVYKDAIEYEFQKLAIPYEREKQYEKHFFLIFNILIIYYTFFHKIIIFLKEFSTKKN